MEHWAEAYVGLTHEAGVFDCADLVELVELAQFDRTIVLPTTRNRSAPLSSFNRTDTPTEGDLVLMLSAGSPNHVGVYCEIDGVPHVLHSAERINTCLHPIAALGKGVFLSIKLEGFYSFLATS